MRRQTRVIVTSLFVLFALVTTAVASNTYHGFPTVRVVVDGKSLVTDVPPIVMDGRTLLPARAVAEAMGVTILWDDTTQTVTITTAGAPAQGGEIERLKNRISELEAEVSRLSSQTGQAPSPTPPNSGTTPAPTKPLSAEGGTKAEPPSLLPKAAAPHQLKRVFVQLPSGKTYLFEEWLVGLQGVFLDGSKLYLTTSSADTFLNVLAGQYRLNEESMPQGLSGQITLPMFTSSFSKVSKGYLGESLDSPWYTVVTMTHNGNRYTFDTKGTDYANEQYNVPIPLPLDELLTQLGIDATHEYNASENTLTFRMK